MPICFCDAGGTLGHNRSWCKDKRSGLQTKRAAFRLMMTGRLPYRGAKRKAALNELITVSEWSHHNILFQTALEELRGENFFVNVDKLRLLSSRAIAILERGLNEEIPLSQIRTAEAVLRSCGLHRARLPLSNIDLSDLEAGRSMRGAFDSIGKMLRAEAEASDDGENALERS